MLDPIPMRERWRALGDALWALGMPVIILGGIYTGFFTATEAASVSVVYAIAVEALIYRELTWKKLIAIFESAAITSCVIFFLIGMGSILAFFLTLFQVPTMIIGLLDAMGGELLIFLLLVNVTLILAGMFLDPASAMLILVPTLYPAAVALGVDPIQFGMIVTLNIAMAMITPPFGLDLFVTSSALGKPIVEVIRGVIPFIGVNLVALAIVTAFPAVSTFLPRLIG
jgi:C4-dicarboxylate transporter DctM subunit